MSEKLKIFLKPKYLVIMIMTVAIFVCGFIFIPALTAQAGGFNATEYNRRAILAYSKISNNKDDTSKGAPIYFGGNEYWIVYLNEDPRPDTSTNIDNVIGALTLVAKKPYLFYGFSEKSNSVYSQSIINKYLNSETTDILTQNEFNYDENTYGKGSIGPSSTLKKYDGISATTLYNDFFASNKLTEWNSVTSGNVSVNQKIIGGTNFPADSEKSVNAKFYLLDHDCNDGETATFCGYAHNNTVNIGTKNNYYMVPLQYLSTVGKQKDGDTNRYNLALSRTWDIDDTTTYASKIISLQSGDLVPGAVGFQSDVTNYSRMINPVCNVDISKILFTSYRNNSSKAETLKYNTSDYDYTSTGKTVILTLEGDESIKSDIELKEDRKDENQDKVSLANQVFSFKTQANTKVETGEYLAAILDDGTTTALATDKADIVKEGTDADGYNVYQISTDKLTNTLGLNVATGTSLSVKVLVCKDNTEGNYTAKGTGEMQTNDLKVSDYFIRYAKVLYSNDKLYSTTPSLLSGLKIETSGLSIDFDDKTNEYQVEADWDYSKLDFSAQFNTNAVKVEMYDWVWDEKKNTEYLNLREYKYYNSEGELEDDACLGTMRNGVSSEITFGEHKRYFFEPGGEIDFPSGDVKIRYKFVVTPINSTSNSTNVYYVTVHSLDNSKLSNLTAELTSKQPISWSTSDNKFNSNVYEYTLTADLKDTSNADKIKFTPTFEKDSTVTIKYRDKITTLTDKTTAEFQIISGIEEFEIMCDTKGKSKFTYIIHMDLKPINPTITPTPAPTDEGIYYVGYLNGAQEPTYPTITFKTNLSDANEKNNRYRVLYTLDGTAPGFDDDGTLNSSTYVFKTNETAIELKETTIVKYVNCAFRIDEEDNIKEKNSVLGNEQQKIFTLENLEAPYKMYPQSDEQYADFDLILRTENNGAKISYEINGKTTQVGTATNMEPILISKSNANEGNITVKAYSCAPNNKDLKSKEYFEKTFTFITFPEPTPSEPAGTYSLDQLSITLDYNDIKYDGVLFTTNGKEPKTDGELYTPGKTTITLNKSEAYKSDSKSLTLKVYAYLGNAEITKSYVYKFVDRQPVTTEKNTPATGWYYANRIEKLKSSDGATIYYTTNGDTPTQTESEYNKKYNGEDITVEYEAEKTKYIKAIAYQDGLNSGVQTFEYIFKSSMDVPVPSIVPKEIQEGKDVPSNQRYYVDLSVTLSHLDKNAKIYYKVSQKGVAAEEKTYKSNEVITIPKVSSSYYVDLIVRAESSLDSTKSGSKTYRYWFMDIPSPTVTPSVETVDSKYYSDFEAEISTANINGGEVKYRFKGKTSEYVTYTEPIEIKRQNADANKQVILELLTSSKYGGSKTETITYTFGSLTAPVATPTAGTYYSSQNVKISSAGVPEGTYYKYTIIGSEQKTYDDEKGIDIVKDSSMSKTLVATACFQETQSEDATFIYSFEDLPTVDLLINGVSVKGQTNEYYNSQNVTLKCSNSNAVIRYSFNEEDVKNGEAGTTVPVSKDKGDRTLYAIASITENGVKIYSEVTKTTVKFKTLAAPNVTVKAPDDKNQNPPYNSEITAEITADSSASIYYTIGGETPSSSSTLYTGKFSITPPTGNKKSVVLKAIAILGDAASEIITKEYEFEMVKEITCDKPDGVYFGDLKATLSCSTEECVIHYTLDGTTPTTASPKLENSTVSIPKKVGITELKAIAFNGDYTSEILKRTYTFKNLSVPESSLPTGTYYQNKEVTLWTYDFYEREDVVIRYTLDSAEPTESSEVYENAIPISKNTNEATVLKVKSFADGAKSTTATFTYAFADIPVPKASVAAGTYYDNINVSLTTDDNVASIKYTLDGTEPTESNGMDYKGLFMIEKTVGTPVTLRAKSYMMEDNSPLFGEEMKPIVYTFESIAPPMSSLPTDATYYSDKNLTLASETKNTMMYYSLNKTEEPTNENATLYSYGDVIKLDKSQKTKDGSITLKTIAYSSDFKQHSTVKTFVYNFKDIEKPKISPDTSDCVTTQTVTMTCSDTSAVIRYTLDGSNPTNASTVYVNGSPFKVSKGNSDTVTIKAAAFYTDASSEVASVTYTFKNVQAPVCTLETGNYYTNQKAVLSCADASKGVTIRYTLDGTEPTKNSAKYQEVLTISKSVAAPIVLTAKSFLNSDVSLCSDSASWTYTFKDLTPPEADIKTGTYYKNQTVKLSNEDKDNTNILIRYTLDGSDPESSSLIYKDSVAITKNITTPVTLKAASFIDDEKSSVATYTYTFKDLPAPIASKPTGNYYSNQSVELTHELDDVAIRYTLDGTEPKESSLLYAAPIVIPKNTATPTQLKAKAYNTDSVSEIGEYTYTFLDISKPIVSPEGGKYIENQVVTAMCATSGTVIRYTLDGTEPTESSEKYSNAINITLRDTPVTLKVKAFYDEASSEVNTQVYTRISDKWYYDSSAGKWQYIENGVPYSGLRSDIPGWNATFMFEDGYMVTGWRKDVAGYNGYVYFEANDSKGNYGAMVRGWINDIPSHSGRWYYLDTTTAINQTGWLHTKDGNSAPDGLTYYILSEESDNYGIALGWKYIAGSWYYFRPDWGGAMAFSTEIDGYQIDASGKMIS